jgi:hypothetical protein
MKWVILISLLALTTPGSGNVETYEGNVLPEDAGWERVGSFDADRWNDDGWFFQYVELGIWDPPPIGETDVYRRPIPEFAGERVFFVEWRVETGAPSSDIDPSVNGTPVVLSAAGDGNALYHFTITDERVRVIRDTGLPVVYVDVVQGVPHTYRLELYWDELYAWYIDGELIDSGIPYGVYPRTDSRIIWGARYYLQEHTTRWDYVRYGRIPIDGSGDFDSDGGVDLGDFYFFHECLTNRRPGINGGPEHDAGLGCRFADFDDDTDVDLRDIADLQNTFTGSD